MKLCNKVCRFSRICTAQPHFADEMLRLILGLNCPTTKFLNGAPAQDSTTIASESNLARQQNRSIRFADVLRQSFIRIRCSDGSGSNRTSRRARIGCIRASASRGSAPKTIVVTTPNAEYNVKFDTLPAGQFRHKDHRFEWTREQFQQWSGRISERVGYGVRFLPVGEEDPHLGAPTQMGFFSAG